MPCLKCNLNITIIPMLLKSVGIYINLIFTMFCKFNIINNYFQTYRTLRVLFSFKNVD